METVNAGNGIELLQLVCFRLSGREYGIPISIVQEINWMRAITRVPEAPESVEGVINLRGKTVPVMNIRKKLALTERAGCNGMPVIIARTGGGTVGIVVDTVPEVRRISSETVRPAPCGQCTGIAENEEGPVVLLDLERIFRPDMGAVPPSPGL